MNPRYKLLVCDVDGTITDDRKRIQTLGIETLRQVQENGYTVSLCSGNVLPVAFGLSTFIGLKGPVIAENGGLVSYKEQIHQLHSDEIARKAFAYLRTKMPEVDRLFTDNWRKTEVAVKRSFDLDAVKAVLSDWNVEIEATGFAIHIMRAAARRPQGRGRTPGHRRRLRGHAEHFIKVGAGKTAVGQKRPLVNGCSSIEWFDSSDNSGNWKFAITIRRQ